MGAYTKFELIRKIKDLVPENEQIARIGDYSSFPYDEKSEVRKYMDSPIKNKFSKY